MIQNAFSMQEHPFTLQLSLGTSAIFYGDQSVKEQRETNFPSSSSRFVMNGEVGTSFFLDEYIALDLGSILGFDWFKYAPSGTYKNSMFLLSYDFFLGCRIYPLLEGFCFGIDYITGGFHNFLKLDGVKYNLIGDWSNGFRIVAEYNILNNRIGWSPAVGVYWQNMARNGGWDNTVAVYARAQLR
ncbi:MAG: hypothetical protein K6G52_08885 [Treponemataceae bacterium]|nr:hypothetical protein [Treponemataceae bacterium]